MDWLGVSLLLREFTLIIKLISGLWETRQTKQPLLTAVQGRRACATRPTNYSPTLNLVSVNPHGTLNASRPQRLLIPSSRPGEFGSFPGLFRAITTIDNEGADALPKSCRLADNKSLSRPRSAS